MATNTQYYNLKKPDESDYYSVQDFNDNADKIDTALAEQAAPTFDDTGVSSTITDFETFKASVVSKMKIVEFFRNLKAGLQYVLHVGSIVNNCVSTSTTLPLSAAQGKSLQDQISVLNAKWVTDTAKMNLVLNGASNTMYIRFADSDGVNYQVTFSKTSRLIRLTCGADVIWEFT